MFCVFHVNRTKKKSILYTKCVLQHFDLAILFGLHSRNCGPATLVRLFHPMAEMFTCSVCVSLSHLVRLPVCLFVCACLLERYSLYVCLFDMSAGRRGLSAVRWLRLCPLLPVPRQQAVYAGEPIQRVHQRPAMPGLLPRRLGAVPVLRPVEEHRLLPSHQIAGILV